MQSPTQLSAKIAENVLSKVTRLFDASLPTILNELLQNARRAGATEVNIRTDRVNNLIIEDNGSGVFRPETIVTLGKSDWDESIHNNEDPAGMGIFSLSQRGVDIHSSNWRIHLNTKCFTGEEKITVHTAPNRTGTLLALPLSPSEVHSLEELIKKATLYYPVNTKFNDKTLQKKDFLEGAVYKKDWNGLKIGLVKDSIIYNYSEKSDGVINFHGITFSNFPLVTPRFISFPYERLKVRIDIIDCPDLKLVLPSRNDVVKDAFYDSLVKECSKTIYEYIATLEEHSLSYSHWLESKHFGITLKEAVPRLDVYTPAEANTDNMYLSSERLSANSVIIDFFDSENSPLQQSFWRGFEKNYPDIILYVPDKNYEGYSWYNSLSRINEVSVTLVDGEKEIINPEEYISRWNKDIYVDKIFVHTTLHSKSEIKKITFDTDIYSINPSPDGYAYSIDDINFVVAKNHSFTSSDIVSYLEASYYNPDPEGDMFDTQLNEFQNAAYKRAVKFLFTEDEALKEIIVQAVNEYIRFLVPQNKSVTIVINENEEKEDNVQILLNDTRKNKE
jgi:hypothetical protein